MKILCHFEKMGMGDCIAAEPTFEALVKKYGEGTEIWINGDDKNVHERCPFIKGTHKEGMTYDIAIGFPNHNSIPIEEYAKLEKMPLVDQYATVAGVVLERRTPSMYITNEEKLWGEEYLRQKGVDLNKFILGISSDNNNDFRRNLRDERYRELCSLVREKMPNIIIVDIGLRSGNPLIGDIFINDLSVRECVSVMSAFDLFVSSNRGISQLAQMAEIPMITVFSLVPPKRTVYEGSWVIAIYPEIDCIFCAWKDLKSLVEAGGCYKAGTPHHCMNMVPASSIYCAIEKFYNRGSNKWIL